MILGVGEGLVELEFDRSGGLEMAPGGDAANVIVMAARLGFATRFAGRVGADQFGEWLVSFWAGQGIDVANVIADADAATGLYLNSAAASGEHRFTYWRNASAGSRLGPGDLKDAAFEDVKVLVVTGVTLAVSASSAAAATEAIDRARRAGAKAACVLNHRPQLGGDVRHLAEIAARCDLVIASAEDLAAVFRVGDPIEVAREALGGVELAVTDGARPASAVSGEDVVTQPVPPQPVANAAGAGDAFAGAYLATRAAGGAPREALAWGVAASAASVTRHGCAASYPGREEVGALVDALPAPQVGTHAG